VLPPHWQAGPPQRSQLLLQAAILVVVVLSSVGDDDCGDFSCSIPAEEDAPCDKTSQPVAGPYRTPPPPDPCDAVRERCWAAQLEKKELTIGERYVNYAACVAAAGC
jgi:hypothetical protein